MTTKTLLILCVADFAAGMLFVTGLVNVQAIPGLYVALPAGAIFFGLFLISKLFEKENTAFDLEEHARLAAASAKTPARSSQMEISCSRIPDRREVTLASS